MHSSQFFGFHNIATSGPVVQINETTLFIPALKFNNKYRDAHFWAGNGSEPDSQGTLIRDENNSTGNLHSYQGLNVYLTLPEGSQTKNFDYFGIWDKSTNTDLGHTLFDKRSLSAALIEDVSAEKTIRLPKCCPFFQIISENGCEEHLYADFQPEYRIFEHNQTHVNNDSLSLDSLRFEAYVYPIECPYGRFVWFFGCFWVF